MEGLHGQYGYVGRREFVKGFFVFGKMGGVGAGRQGVKALGMVGLAATQAADVVIRPASAASEDDAWPGWSRALAGGLLLREHVRGRALAGMSMVLVGKQVLFKKSQEARGL